MAKIMSYSEAEKQENIMSDWLEDSCSGRFSRYATGKPEGERSTWVCQECGDDNADPYDDGYLSCGAIADGGL